MQIIKANPVIIRHTSVRKQKKILSFERTGCDATRKRKFSSPTLRRSTKSGSRLSADSLCHTNSAYSKKSKYHLSPARQMKKQNEKQSIHNNNFSISLSTTHPFLWQRRNDDVGVGDQEVCSEQLKVTVTSPQSVRNGWRPSLWDRFSWPAHV